MLHETTTWQPLTCAACGRPIQSQLDVVYVRVPLADNPARWEYYPCHASHNYAACQRWIMRGGAAEPARGPGVRSGLEQLILQYGAAAVQREVARRLPPVKEPPPGVPGQPYAPASVWLESEPNPEVTD